MSQIENILVLGGGRAGSVQYFHTPWPQYTPGNIPHHIPEMSYNTSSAKPQPSSILSHNVTAPSHIIHEAQDTLH
jgi:hypothetical protein